MIRHYVIHPYLKICHYVIHPTKCNNTYIGGDIGLFNILRVSVHCTTSRPAISAILAPTLGRLFALTSEKLVITILLLFIIRRRRAAKRLNRRQCVREILRRRPISGEYHTLTPEQRLFDYKSHQDTFRMTPPVMPQLLEKIGAKLAHQPSHLNPIDLGERLAVTLK